MASEIVDQIVTFPRKATLNEIVKSDTLDIVSPFYSAWALQKLNEGRIRFITRLPLQYHAAAPFLDNDPIALKTAMERLGSSLAVYAMPTVHAKMYITKKKAWIGSANFTKNGFSGKGEILLRISPKTTAIDRTFREFRLSAVRVSLEDVAFLSECVQRGVTRVATARAQPSVTGDVPVIQHLSYDDFKEWLITRPQDENITYIRDRSENKYRMSGHVYSGFYGLCSLMISDPLLARNLLEGATDESALEDRVAAFVRDYGNLFGGPRGGTWNSKLSTRFGGTQSGGGAGDIIVRRMLPLIATYLHSKNYF